MMCPDIVEMLPPPLVPELTQQRSIAISAVEAKVLVDGKPGSMSLKELALLVALSRLPRAYHRDALCAELWPESSREAAMNSLRVCVARVRKRLGFYQVIRTAQEGFQLSPDVDVDLWKFAELHETVRMNARPSEELTPRVADAFKQLIVERPAQLSYWPWFHETEQRLVAYVETLGNWLIRDARNRGDDMAARTYARDMQLRGIPTVTFAETAEAFV